MYKPQNEVAASGAEIENPENLTAD
jgi:hypothetical protein